MKSPVARTAQGLQAEGETGSLTMPGLIELHDLQAVFTLVSEQWDPNKILLII